MSEKNEAPTTPASIPTSNTAQAKFPNSLQLTLGLILACLLLSLTLLTEWSSAAYRPNPQVFCPAVTHLLASSTDLHPDSAPLHRAASVYESAASSAPTKQSYLALHDLGLTLESLAKSPPTLRALRANTSRHLSPSALAANYPLLALFLRDEAALAPALTPALLSACPRITTQLTNLLTKH